jgi:hypothetical protein
MKNQKSLNSVFAKTFRPQEACSVRARGSVGSIGFAGVAGAIQVFLAGCSVSPTTQATLDGIMGARNDLEAASVAQSKPIVEAYIDFPGPPEKWVGPAGLLLHVTAREGKSAKVVVTSPGLDGHAPLLDAVRGLASENALPDGKNAEAKIQKGISVEAARERLSFLARALTEGAQFFQGCLNPVRVRLIRQDGSIFERSGCRGQVGWSRSASEAVSDFLTAAIYGSGPSGAVAALRSPASASGETTGSPSGVASGGEVSGSGAGSGSASTPHAPHGGPSKSH